MADPKETVIVLDHDEGTIRVDTRSDAVASMCRKAGMTHIESIRSGQYKRFRGELSSVLVRIRRKRVADADAVARLALARKAKTGKEPLSSPKKTVRVVQPKNTWGND